MKSKVCILALSILLCAGAGAGAGVGVGTGAVASAQTNVRTRASDHVPGARVYTPNGNAHSHNDYLRKRPFREAYENRFGSIELDVFLVDGRLCVAHTRMGIRRSSTVESLYLEPLVEQIKLGGGRAYPDGGKLQFLIDLKTGGETLRALEELFKPVRSYFDTEQTPDAVRLVISGSMPPPSRFSEYDTIFFFDGRAEVHYTDEQLARVAFFSAPLSGLTDWNGRNPLPEANRRKITAFVERIHSMGKKVRFWGCPDTETCWQTFIGLGVDYINTDDPAGLARFLNEKTRIFTPNETD